MTSVPYSFRSRMAKVEVRTGSINGVELEASRTEVLDSVRVLPLRRYRRVVEREVVVDELAEKDEADGEGRIVGRCV